MVRHNQLRWTTSSKQGIVGRSGAAGSTAAGAATMHDFDKKLAEADSYLQILLSELI